MVRQRDYQLGLYNEFEKLNKKLDSLLKENKEQSLIIYELKPEIKKNEEESKKDKELIKKINRRKRKTKKSK